MTVCPKCGHERQPKDDDFVPGTECPKCGIIYEKYAAMQRQLEENDRLSAAQQDKESTFHSFSATTWICIGLLLITTLIAVYTISDDTNATIPPVVIAVNPQQRVAVARGIPQARAGDYAQPKHLDNVAINKISTPNANDSLKELSSTLDRLSGLYEQRLNNSRLYHNDLSSHQWKSIKASPNYKKIQSILHNYRVQHTYMTNEFFVCVDMAMDVWNLLATAGIKSRFVVGNVQDDIAYNNTVSKYIANINHAWLMAEVSPSLWIPLETTGGGIVEPSMKNYELYNKGIAFDTPKELKDFNGSRDAIFSTCSETASMQTNFNQSYAGKPISTEAIEYIGRMKQKVNDCERLVIKVTSRLRDG